jgi:NADPH2:quinone reductase
VDQLGVGVPSEFMGRSVWCYAAQSYRPFGTAAEFTVVPLDQVAPLPEGVPMEQGACLVIPDITAHRAVHVAGFLNGRTVLVQGAAGSVGLCAVQLARFAGARVIGTVRSSSDEATAKNAGAHEVLVSDRELTSCVKALAPDGIDHIVEVAFGANIEADVEFPKQGGSEGAHTLATQLPAA